MAALPARDQRYFRGSEMFNSTSALLAERENLMDYYRFFSGASWVSGAYGAYAAGGQVVNESVVASPMGQRNGYTGNGHWADQRARDPQPPERWLRHCKVARQPALLRESERQKKEFVK